MLYDFILNTHLWYKGVPSHHIIYFMKAVIMRTVKTKDMGRFSDQTALSVLEEEVEVRTHWGGPRRTF